jgi:hypothetical protein
MWRTQENGKQKILISSFTKLRRKKMIKWIKNLFKKKIKKSYSVLYKNVLKPEIKKICDKHPDSFKKTCPSCRAAK